jgi:hypothetical protein
MFAKIVEIHHHLKKNTLLIYIFNVVKKLDKVYSDFKDYALKQNLMLELCLRWELLKLILDFYSLGVTFFSFQICDFKIFVVYIFI